MVHEFTRQTQANSNVCQKRAYDSQCHGQPFLPGDKVWVYSPERKKGVSPKLRSHWRGPAEMVARLSDVIYRVHMSRGGAPGGATSGQACSISTPRPSGCW